MPGTCLYLTYLLQIYRVFKTERHQEDSKATERELAKLDDKKDKIEELVLSSAFAEEKFQRKISEVEKQITDKIIELQDYEKTITHITPLLENLNHLFRNICKLGINTDFDHKRKVQEIIFPNGIFILNEKCRTDRMVSFFGVLQQNNSLKSKVVPMSSAKSNCILKELEKFQSIVKPLKTNTYL